MTSEELANLCARFRDALICLNDEVHITVILTIDESSHIESTLDNDNLVNVTKSIYMGALRQNDK